ncbi:MAG: OmpA family protein [Mariprofundaceae bacterium]|nr:OmpA family protein [Mariprofundaceae bacterium]
MNQSVFRHRPAWVSRLLLAGCAVLVLSSCAQTIQPWVELKPSGELKKLKIENYLLKQEVAKYRKKVMHSNLENRKLAQQIQSGSQVSSSNLNRSKPSASRVSAGKPIKAKMLKAKQKWSMQMRLLFASGQQGISKSMKASLTDFAKTLPAEAMVRVAGFSDNELVKGGKTKQTAAKDEGANKSLSRNRARAVVRALIAAGLSAKRIQLGAFGSTHPIASNATPEGRAKNRRVEVLTNMVLPKSVRVKKSAAPVSPAPTSRAVKAGPRMAQTDRVEKELAKPAAIHEKPTSPVKPQAIETHAKKMLKPAARVQIAAQPAIPVLNDEPLVTSPPGPSVVAVQGEVPRIKSIQSIPAATKKTLTVKPETGQVKQVLKSTPPVKSMIEPVAALPSTPAVKPATVQSKVESLAHAVSAQTPVRPTNRTLEAVAPSAQHDGWSLEKQFFFDPGQRFTSNAIRRQLRNFARHLPPHAQLRIVGHSDDRKIYNKKPSLEDNKAMSLERAKSVFRGLKAYGVSPQRMQVEGLGASQPVASNKTADGRAKNRRVEILIHTPAERANTATLQEADKPVVNAVQAEPEAIESTSLLPPVAVVAPAGKPSLPRPLQTVPSVERKSSNTQQHSPTAVKAAALPVQTAASPSSEREVDGQWSSKMSLLFDLGQRFTSPAMRQQLRKLAQSLPAHVRLRIIGHSDNKQLFRKKPSLEDNKAMSLERAKSVFRGLKAYGVKPERMQVEAQGASQPVASNETADGRAKNRRVEILISG